MGTWIDTRTEREEMMDLMSDMSKDLYGFRVRYIFDAMTDQEMKDEIKSLGKDLDAQLEREMNLQKTAEIMYELDLRTLMENHHITHKDAVRWMMQAQNFKMNEMYSERENFVEFLMMNVGLGSTVINEEIEKLNLNSEINFGY